MTRKAAGGLLQARVGKSSSEMGSLRRGCGAWGEQPHLEGNGVHRESLQVLRLRGELRHLILEV